MYFDNLCVDVIHADRRANLDEAELLDDNDVDVEFKSSLGLGLRLLLLLALATADSEDVLLLALLFAERVLDLASLDFLLKILSGGLAEEVSLCVASHLLRVLHQSCFAL